MQSICILSCSAEKRATKTRAENLYVSETFFLSRRYAQANFDRWLVLSAKHGILSPGTSVEPYDLSMDDLSEQQRAILSDRLRDQMGEIRATQEVQFTSLCTEQYNRALEMGSVPIIRSPIGALPREEKHAQLRSLTDPRNSEADLNEAYRIIQRLTGKRRPTPLKEA